MATIAISCNNQILYNKPLLNHVVSQGYYKNEKCVSMDIQKRCLASNQPCIGCVSSITICSLVLVFLNHRFWTGFQDELCARKQECEHSVHAQSVHRQTEVCLLHIYTAIFCMIAE